MLQKNSAIIVGAGISGSCTAYHLNNKGWDVTLIDSQGKNDVPIYTNPAVGVYPKIMLNDPKFNKLMNLSINYVWQLIKKINLSKNESSQVGAVHLFEKNDGLDRYKKILKDTLYTYNDIKLLDEALIKNKYGINNHVGFLFNAGGWIKPKAFCRKLIADKKINTFFDSTLKSVKKNKSCWEITTETGQKITASNIIFCNASDIRNYSFFHELSHESFRGQVDWFEDKSVTQQEILSNDGYMIPSVGEKIIFGSTYQKNGTSFDQSHLDSVSNKRKLNKLAPGLIKNDKDTSTKSWVGQRAASFDKKPYVGRVLKERDVRITPNKFSLEELYWHDNIYLNACYGSRGFSFAPIASLSLVNLITNKLTTDDKFILNYLNPERKFFKKSGIKKKEIY